MTDFYRIITLLLVTATDWNDVVSVIVSKGFTIEEPVYPELLYCDPVTRPNVPYGCSIVMFGSLGLTSLTYSNTATVTRDIPSGDN